MRVLHVSTAREWRGGETQLLHLVRGASHEAAVALPPDAPLASALDRAGLRTFPVPFGGRWTGGAGLRAAVRAFRPDLLAAHDPHASVHAARARGPVVVHRRVDFAPSPFGARRYRRAAGVIAVSAAVAAVLRARGVERCAVVHDGVEPVDVHADPDGVRAELGLPPGTPLVVAAGALVAHKGHAVLLDAMSEVPGVHVAILGEGRRRGALAARARRLGRPLHLPGRRDDVPRWLASADVVAHPSVEEGLGQAVIEALLAGAAVVATSAGGIGEIGLPRLVPPGDPRALGAALREALDDPRPLRAFALESRATLRERFGVARMIAETERASEAFLR